MSKCDLIRDLLPLYVDGAASKESAAQWRRMWPPATSAAVLCRICARPPHCLPRTRKT